LVSLIFLSLRPEWTGVKTIVATERSPMMERVTEQLTGSGRRGEAMGARARILDAAYELFSRNGIQAVGIEAVISRSGVARQTLYRHFASKQDLVLAFLERREREWTRRWLEGEVRRRAGDPTERLLAIFDIFDEWFGRADFEGCSFINVMLEHPDPRDPLHRASVSYLSGIRGLLEGLAREAGIVDAQDFAREWHILMKGSIVAAGEGDRQAARRAKRIGGLLLKHVIASSQLPAPPLPESDPS
jgi:AcrR family transcriptional regulator